MQRRYLGSGGEEEEEQEIKKTNSGGNPVPMPPWGPWPLLRSWESVGEEKLPEGAPEQVCLLLPKGPMAKGNSLGNRNQYGAFVPILGDGGPGAQVDMPKSDGKALSLPSLPMSTKWVSIKMRQDGGQRGYKRHSGRFSEDYLPGNTVVLR